MRYPQDFLCSGYSVCRRRVTAQVNRSDSEKGSASMKNYNQFHDGALEGLWIDDSTVHVHVCTLQNVPFTVVAEAVVALSAGGLRTKNLIFEVVTREQDELTLADIGEVYDLKEGPSGETQ